MGKVDEPGQERVRRGVAVRGVVQGVGFRPFVYRLATEEGLAGSIGNDTDGVTIDRKNQVIVVRYQQHLYAFNLACPHENTALKWLPKDGRFQCPKHESRYQPTGTFIDGRATRHMDRLGVRLDNNMLVVDVSQFYRSDKDAAAWTAANVAL